MPEINFDRIRPGAFEQFAGQPDVTEPLQVAIASALARGAAMPHVLLSGPPGLGKTTLAGVVANELGTRLIRAHGAMMDKPNDLAGILATVGAGDVFFIDEIHRLPAKVEESMYTALEDFRIELIIGDGADAKATSLTLQPFCCIGATTRLDLIQPPMRARFPLRPVLRPYPPDDLLRVLMFGAGELDITVDEEAATVLVEHSRGTPRVVLQLLGTCRDVLSASDAGTQVDRRTAIRALELAGVGPLGLDQGDLDYLAVLVDKNAPVGVKTLANMARMNCETAQEVHEPYLMELGLIEMTPRGRIATQAGKNYIRQFAQV